MQLLAHLLTSVLFSISNAASLPASADVPEDVCGKSPISADSQCELLTGDACTAACDATDWSEHCQTQCCDGGGCDPNCQTACEFNSWGDCTFTWCGNGNQALFCEGQPKATDVDLGACLDLLCDTKVDVEGLSCGAELPRKSAAKKRF